MVALLDALTRPNVTVYGTALNTGSNSRVTARVNFDSWAPWNDFNYSNLIAIYGNILSDEYHGSREPVALPLDVTLYDEYSFEDVLRRFVIPPVNYALSRQRSRCHYGRGSRYQLPTGEIPDWSLFSTAITSDNGEFVSILPGDTKTSAKWWPDLILHNHLEWKKPVAQVCNYMTALCSRYGFIITDKNLVVLRLIRAPTADGLSQNRGRRDGISYHRQYPSDASGMTTGSEFSNADASGWDYWPPEYAVVSWGAHGQGRLTIKLALWCLAMMASSGGYLIDYDYTDLDVWVPSNGRFLNQTTGVARSSVPRGHRRADQLGQAGSSRSEGSSHGHGSSSRYTAHYRVAESSASQPTIDMTGSDRMEISDDNVDDDERGNGG